MTLRLNDMKPGRGAKRLRLRVGRGASAGQGKTCGRGVKGQRARKGGYHKVGFEGGQMPLQRRLPKQGFRSAIKPTRAEVRLDELAGIDAPVIDLGALIAANIVPVYTEKAKVILSGSLTKAITLKGVAATRGARAAIEAAGGKIDAELVSAKEAADSKVAARVAARAAANAAKGEKALKEATREAAKKEPKAAKEPGKEPKAPKEGKAAEQKAAQKSQKPVKEPKE
jgi:large subunit ribosomal protein L15